MVYIAHFTSQDGISKIEIFVFKLIICKPNPQTFWSSGTAMNDITNLQDFSRQVMLSEWKKKKKLSDSSLLIFFFHCAKLLMPSLVFLTSAVAKYRHQCNKRNFHVWSFRPRVMIFDWKLTATSKRLPRFWQRFWSWPFRLADVRCLWTFPPVFWHRLDDLWWPWQVQSWSSLSTYPMWYMAGISLWRSENMHLPNSEPVWNGEMKRIPIPLLYTSNYTMILRVWYKGTL